MRLSDLTAFAEEKYHILEQHKWANFPGVSVLVDPNTQKWVALLMRGWDAELGEEIELCDLKCGMESLSGSYNSFISPPFRMRGKNWLGVRFNGNTEKDIVYRLFDKAMSAGEQRGFTIILGSEPAAQQTQNRETPIPFGKAPASEKNALLPEKIREMMSLYTYGDGSFRQKCRNFYIQGKCMADYEDNAPWNGAFHRYFTTYHDLSIKQLRGYFTWRTKLRKGIYEPVSTSLAYLYVYELLNGIGADSTEDALLKMRELNFRR